MNTLIRFERPMSTLSTLFDDFFGNDAFESINRELTGTHWPKVDINESETGYTVRADLPGLDKDAVKITVENGTLRIEGEKKEESKKEKGRYYHLERSYGRFNRSFALPDDIDTQNIGASMNHGVLELILPKNEQAKPKTIEVKVN